MSTAPAPALDLIARAEAQEQATEELRLAWADSVLVPAIEQIFQ